MYVFNISGKLLFILFKHFKINADIWAADIAVIFATGHAEDQVWWPWAVICSFVELISLWHIHRSILKFNNSEGFRLFCLKFFLNPAQYLTQTLFKCCPFKNSIHYYYNQIITVNNEITFWLVIGLFILFTHSIIVQTICVNLWFEWNK